MAKKKSVKLRKEEKQEKKTSLDVVDIEINNLIPNEWNPNSQSNETFDNLVASIDEHGCDQPLLVCPAKDEGKYVIIGGEHRYRAMRTLGMTFIPCIVKPDWDETKQKIETVRRNILSGELDEQKFTELVNSIVREDEIDMETLSAQMGFDSFNEFATYYIEQQEEDEEIQKEALSLMVEKADEKVKHVDNITIIIQAILSKFSDTLPCDFMWFMYRRKLHTYVRMSKKTSDLMSKVTAYLKETMVENEEDGSIESENINLFIQEAFLNELKRRKVNLKDLKKKGDKKKEEMKEVNLEDLEKEIQDV